MVQKPKDAKKALRRLIGNWPTVKWRCFYRADQRFGRWFRRCHAHQWHHHRRFYRHGRRAGIARICLVLLAIYLTNVIAQFFQQRMMVRVAQDTTAKLRRDLFAHLSGLKLSYFDTHNSGDLMSRLTNDVDTISMTLSQSVAQLFSGVVSLLGTLAAMLILRPAADADQHCDHCR
jgi:ABC-type multidrug transport system fused ATPase/permease subunit